VISRLTIRVPFTVTRAPAFQGSFRDIPARRLVSGRVPRYRDGKFVQQVSSEPAPFASTTDVQGRDVIPSVFGIIWPLYTRRCIFLGHAVSCLPFRWAWAAHPKCALNYTCRLFTEIHYWAEADARTEQLLSEPYLRYDLSLIEHATCSVLPRQKHPWSFKSKSKESSQSLQCPKGLQVSLYATTNAT
jgi:hypothetical protein